MDDITIREATPDDKDGVIKIHENVYDGRDYIASLYDVFLDCPDTIPFVAELNGTIVAFTAMLLIDEGSTLVTRAGRSSPRVAGQGIYNKLKSFVQSEAAKRGAKVNAFTTANINQAIYTESFRRKNKEILRKPMIRFLVDIASLNKTLDEMEPLPIPNDDEMKFLFTNKSTKSYLFPKDRILCSWVPYKLLPSNLSHMRRPKRNKKFISDVNLDSDGNVHGLLSSSTTFQCVDPPYFTDLDIHGTDVRSLKRHVMCHFRYVRKIASGMLSLLVFVEPDFNKDALLEVFEELGIKESEWLDSHNPEIIFSDQFLFETEIG